MRRRFSDERMGFDPMVTRGDERVVARLYRWTNHCSGVCWEAPGYQEVTLHAFLAARLVLHQLTRGGMEDWVFDDDRQLGSGAWVSVVALLRSKTSQWRSGESTPPESPLTLLGSPQNCFRVLASICCLQVDILLAPIRCFVGPRHVPLPGVGATWTRPDARDLRSRSGHNRRIVSLDLDERWNDVLTLAGRVDAELHK